MNVYGFDSVQSLLTDEGYFFKLLANDSGVLFFPHTTEHRDATAPGLRYADDSAGNALAGTVKPGRIEIRFHRSFTDQHVRLIAQRMLSHPELKFAAAFAVVYQGRTLITATSD